MGKTSLKKWSAEVKKMHVFLEHSTYHILYECKGGFWFRTTNGSFGQRETYVESIHEDEAKKILKPTNP